jgi:hypothetical protein
MAKNTIFTHEGNILGKDPKSGDLYWNGEKILTEQKLSLNWWVNVSIVLGALSTAVMAIIAILNYLK